MKKNGLIDCSQLKNSWLLMAHNPNPREMTEIGVRQLEVLERNGCSSFDHQTRYSSNVAIANAAAELEKIGIENGGGERSKMGSLAFIVMRGRNTESYTLNPDNVVDIAIETLNIPDNSRKVSAASHPSGVERHFFVVVDPITHPDVGDCMKNVEPPVTTLDLHGRATHLWIAIRDAERVIVWKSCANGWTRLGNILNGH